MIDERLGTVEGIMIEKNWLNSMQNVLESYSNPAVLIDSDYNVVLSNPLYDAKFGELNRQANVKCYFLSHGYHRPCDLEGETCPMQEASDAGRRATVLHIHNTAQGKEHVGIETIPVSDEQQKRYYIEVMKPILEVSAEPIANKMIGRSPAFNNMVDLIQRVGKTDTNVLLMGPSGAGKELAAQAIHSASLRSSKPFVTVECSGLTDTLFESELFGHAKGAFTGATHSRSGLVKEAEGGTLFLDEVGDIPLHLQVKLLRLIETRMYRSVGDTKPLAANFRLICATHKYLPTMVDQGAFREDLFHRISTFPIQLPSLAERQEDIPLLVKSILLRISPDTPITVDADALLYLSSHPFKGNIRELKNILERACVLRNDHRISLDIIERSLNLIPRSQNVVTPSVDTLKRMASERASLDEVEQVYLNTLLNHYPDKETVAEIAGVSLRTLYRKLNS